MFQWSTANEDAARDLRRALSEEANPRQRKLVDQSGWSFSDPLPSSRNDIEPRYGNVPPEAFPFLHSHADGCHYALWIDDPASESPPSVVWVCPMDGTPETIQPVAATVEEFHSLVLEHGLWLAGLGDESDTVTRARNGLLATRQQLAYHATRDRFGVVCKDEPPTDRPSDKRLRQWSVSNSDAFEHAASAWLAASAPGLALAVARDLIAEAGIPGLGGTLANIYKAMKRPVLGAIADSSYT